MCVVKISARILGAVVGVLLVMAISTAAQQAPGPNAPAEQVYKNIQVLKGVAAGDVIQAMHLIKADVGLDCEDCHEEKDRSLDTLKPKLVARDMWRMMMDLNKNMFQGKQMVTCYTCHRGVPNPANVPTLPVTQWKEPAKIVLPTVDQILSKYIDALGGEQALRKVSSRVVTGTQFIASGPGGSVPMPASVEKFMKAPNLSASVYHTPTYTISDGFDGNAAWSQNLQGNVTAPPPIDQDRARRAADFYEPLNLKKEYAQLTVDRIEPVNGHDAYVVTGLLPGNAPPERLYFDALTGLLLRKSTALATPAGDSPFEVNYDDYRDTGSGVKFPFVIRMNPAGPRIELDPTATLLITKVQDNVTIEDAKLAKPAPKAPPAR